MYARPAKKRPHIGMRVHCGPTLTHLEFGT